MIAFQLGLEAASLGFATGKGQYSNGGPALGIGSHIVFVQ
jgi:hypothetical protein